MARKKKAKLEEAEVELKTSIKTYQQGIDSEKRKMADYSKKFGTTVKSLKNDFKRHGKEMREAALNMVEEGRREMRAKVNQFKADIKSQIKENKEAVKKIGASVRFFRSEINGKKRDFEAYARGPFTNYIKAFWG